MIVPSDISNTKNVYHAFLAMLKAVDKHNNSNKTKINTVLCPRFGTATSRMDNKEAAKQMVDSYNYFKKQTRNRSWINRITSKFL